MFACVRSTDRVRVRVGIRVCGRTNIQQMVMKIEEWNLESVTDCFLVCSYMCGCESPFACVLESVGVFLYVEGCK